MLIVVFFFTIRRGAIVSSGYMATADALLRKRDYLGLLAVSNRHGEAIARVDSKDARLHDQEPDPPILPTHAKSRKPRARRIATSLQNRVTYLAGYRDDRPAGRLVRHRHWNYPLLRRARLRARVHARYVLLSKGISEAFINTCGGLGIGITAHDLLRDLPWRAQRLISDLEARDQSNRSYSFPAANPPARAGAGFVGRRVLNRMRDPRYVTRDAGFAVHDD
mgnify:CR=1 FL=1